MTGVQTCALPILQHPAVKDWFSGTWELYNECAIVYTDEQGQMQTRRPDDSFQLLLKGCTIEAMASEALVLPMPMFQLLLKGCTIEADYRLNSTAINSV